MNRLPSFAESVIIPLEIYKEKFTIKDIKQKPAEKFSSTNDILLSNLPSDLKLKLFDQTKLKEKKKRDTFNDGDNEYKSKSNFKQNLKENIYELFPDNDKENVKEIFELYIDRNPYIIDWDRDTYEAILYERKLDNSNIVKILQYLLNPQGDKPLGTYQVYRTLIDLGAPYKLFATVLSPPSSSSSFATPPQSTIKWSSVSSTPTKSLTPLKSPAFSPIANRVKRRTSRKPKVPYTPQKWESL